MSDAEIRRRGWIAAGLAFAVWITTTAYVAYRVFIVGLSLEYQQAVDHFYQQPFQTLTEPLVMMLLSTTTLAAFVAFSLLYIGYERWRYAHLNRLAVEYENLENEGD